MIAAVLQQVLIEDDAQAPKPAAEHNPFRMWRYMSGELKQLLPPAKAEYVEKQPTLEDIFQ